MNNSLPIIFRKANRDDVKDIVRLLSEDEMGCTREKCIAPLPQTYYAAFTKIDVDQNSLLIVAELAGKIVGTLQLTFIVYLTYQGGKRALIEGVRVDAAKRGLGVGAAMLNWAVQKSKEEECHMVQLTTDKRRKEALAFYQQLGFVASHEGMKLYF